MNKLFENPSEIFALSKECTRKLYDNLYDEMIQEGKDVVDYQWFAKWSTELSLQNLWQTIQSNYWHFYVRCS